MNTCVRLTRSLVKGIDHFTEKTGRTVAWLNLLLMLVVCTVVLLRYLFNQGSIALQESATWIHTVIFLSACAWTLKHNGHVRVDIFYRRFSPRRQALVNALGSLFLLLPVCVLIGVMSWEYVSQSWAIRETSQEAGGLPALYLLKSLILVLTVTLILQGVAEALRNLLIFTGHDAPPADAENLPREAA